MAKKVIHLDRSGGGAGFGWDGQVEFRGDLPVTVGTPAIGSIYLVEKPTTLLGFTTYQSGLYLKDTDTGSLSDWRRLNVKVVFTDSEFAIVKAADTTAKAKFDLTALSTSMTRTLQVQDKDGTLALVSDVSAIKTILNGAGLMNSNAFIDGTGSLYDVIFANIGDFSVFTGGPLNDITFAPGGKVVISAALAEYVGLGTDISNIDAAPAKTLVSKEWVESKTLKTKSGISLNASFSGNPKKTTVTFTTPFADANYSITFGIEANNGTQYVPDIENKTANGFIINMSVNNINDLVAVDWICVKHGEN